jgi:outer membrane protein
MRKLIITIVALFTFGAYSASAQKIGHLNYIQVMDSIDTYQLANKKGEELQSEFEETMKYLQEDYTKKATIYQEEMDDLPQILREMREQELYQIQQLSEAKQQEYQRSLQLIQERYYTPLEDWLKQAVEIVGKAKNLDYVLYYDEQSSVFWVNPDKGVDITMAVIAEMKKIEKANPILIPGG